MGDVEFPGSSVHGFMVRSMPPPLPLTDTQREALAEATVQGYLAVLGAIVREAARQDSEDGPRNVSRLTMSLQNLGPALGLRGGPFPWFGNPPWDEDAEDGD
jgi:hypothetical protein